MTDVWVCGTCRSVNHAGQRRCYKCDARRSAAEWVEVGAHADRIALSREAGVLAAAHRAGARYVPTWWLAIVAVGAILVTTSIDMVRQEEVERLISPVGQVIDDPATFDRLDRVIGILAVSQLIGLVVWSIWISIVVSNVPSLTARWPSYGWLAALLAGWIPIISLKRPYSVVRAVIATLTNGRAGPLLIALAWWLVFLASFAVPLVVLAVIAAGGGDGLGGGAIQVASRVRIGLTVAAAILAIAVIVIIEREQRVALHRRAAAVLTVDSPTA